MAAWDPITQRDSGSRALQVARCSLCGLERPVGLMVPDGGEACDDVRWYCKDAQTCTLRWTSRAAELAAGNTAAREPGQAEPMRDRAEPGRPRVEPMRDRAEPMRGFAGPAEVPADRYA